MWYLFFYDIFRNKIIAYLIVDLELIKNGVINVPIICFYLFGKNIYNLDRNPCYKLHQNEATDKQICRRDYCCNICVRRSKEQKMLLFLICKLGAQQEIVHYIRKELTIVIR